MLSGSLVVRKFSFWPDGEADSMQIPSGTEPQTLVQPDSLFSSDFSLLCWHILASGGGRPFAKGMDISRELGSEFLVMYQSKSIVLKVLFGLIQPNSLIIQIIQTALRLFYELHLPPSFRCRAKEVVNKITDTHQVEYI